MRNDNFNAFEVFETNAKAKRTKARLYYGYDSIFDETGITYRVSFDDNRGTYKEYDDFGDICIEAEYNLTDEVETKEFIEQLGRLTYEELIGNIRMITF